MTHTPPAESRRIRHIINCQQTTEDARLKVDTADISDDARLAAMLAEADEDGTPLVKGGSGNDCVTGAFIAITLTAFCIVALLATTFWHLIAWITTNWDEYSDWQKCGVFMFAGSLATLAVVLVAAMQCPEARVMKL